MKNREEIMALLKEEITKLNSKKSNNNSTELWNEKQKILENETFHLVYSVGNWSKFYYYISNIGRVIVVNTENPKKEINLVDLEEGKYCFAEINNGYLKEQYIKLSGTEIKLTTSTDIYKFMIEAGWLEGDESKNLAEKIVKEGNYQNDRIELHHIDNNPSNNSIDNLVWVPKSIHQTLHKQN